jgi:hypothetical protein
MMPNAMERLDGGQPGPRVGISRAKSRMREWSIGDRRSLEHLRDLFVDEVQAGHGLEYWVSPKSRSRLSGETALLEASRLIESARCADKMLVSFIWIDESRTRGSAVRANWLPEIPYSNHIG